MKRFRVRAVGLGLALAGSAVAADGDWRAPGPPAGEVIPAGGPGLLPPAMRAAPVGAGAIWLPARQPAPAAPLVTPTGGTVPDPSAAVPPIVPAPQPQVQQQPQPQPEGLTFGPRANGGTGALPEIPIPVPEVPEPPAAPLAPAPQQPDPLPQPKVVDPPAMLPPRAPEYVPPANPLPVPRPLDMQPPDQPQTELPPAPASLMYPAGALGVNKHGAFGSLPIRLSRDYPPLRDLAQHGDLAILGDGAGGGGPSSRFFVRGEYLLWWLPGFATPVLATTNPNAALNGYLGEPGTAALLGPGAFVGSTRSGLRVRAGLWFDDSASCGLDASAFFLGRRSASAALGSDQFPLITRPIFAPNLVPGTNAPLGENGEAVAVPGILRSTLSARGDSRLWGADVNLRKSLCSPCDTRAEVFAGYRHLGLRESLTVTEDITVIGPGGDRLAITDPIGTRVVVQDRFATRNDFNGGQIGALYERRIGRWDWDARGSVALGSTHQVLDIDGFQVRQRPGAAPMTFRGGLLAAGPNLGHFTRDRFSVVPEISLNVGYQVTPGLRVYAGYNFLYWTNVVRPGDQIDRTVDLTFVPNALAGANFSGQFRPRPLFKQSDLAVNGIQVGLDWRW